ncbi:aminoacyl-tRNA hydrolase [Isachenkonia alkalipeptolytica]|nr:aminoacyl-tRNA hydrolase [Isachenkonia alkalipeptolytica]
MEKIMELFRKIEKEKEKPEAPAQGSETYVIVGLGNPGKKYATTRHNVGFLALDTLAMESDIKITKIKYKALIGEGRIGGKKVVLVKPQTYMNKSGESVQELLNFYKIPLDNLVVIYDDIDLDPGRLRIRKKGSGGSHNGMRSIIRLLGDDGFPRIRIGVGRPERQDLASFVLSPFAEEEKRDVAETIEKASMAAKTIVSEGLDIAMNTYNG